MKKETKIIIAVVAVIIVVIVAFAIFFKGNGNKTNLAPVNTAEELSALVDKVYEGQENLLPSLATNIVDVTDANMVKYATGLENGNDLEFVVTSEPMMSSQAYSFILVKVKDGVNANNIAKQMSEQINTRKWICVAAEKVYATSSGDIVCLVMSSEKWGKPIYEKFKTLAGNVGTEYEQTPIEDFPDEMTAL